jgi:hypothetical protein
MADPEIRRAARLAALIAVPAALVAGFVAFQILAPDDTPDGAPDDVTGTGAAATSPVDVPAPSLAARPGTVCRALLAKLPDRLGDLARRPVTAGSEQNAAYGDPAVTIACGVPGPTPPDGAQYLQINGVCWYAEEGADAATWSLQEREVPLVVKVPKAYTAQDLVDLAKPVTDAIAQTTQVC